MSSSTLIVRRFLLPNPAPGISGRGRLIRKGCLLHEELREAMLCDDGGRLALCVAEGDGLQVNEIWLPLGRRRFESLWALTEDQRLEKRRYQIRHEGLRVAVDEHLGDHSPLRIAEVRFKDAETNQRFVPPAIFGQEITGLRDYADRTLAVEGVPEGNRTEHHFGCAPFLFEKEGLRLVLVTRSSGIGWIVPKGRPEVGLGRRDVILMEAAEEAGIVGKLLSGFRTTCVTEDGRTLHLHAMRVTGLLKRWPESDERRRIVLPVEEALDRIAEVGLREAVARLAARVGSATPATTLMPAISRH